MKDITLKRAREILAARAGVDNDYQLTELPTFVLEIDEPVIKGLLDICGALVKGPGCRWLYPCCDGRTILTAIDFDCQLLRQFAPMCPLKGRPCPRAQLMRELAIRRLHNEFLANDMRLSVELLNELPDHERGAAPTSAAPQPERK